MYKHINLNRKETNMRKPFFDNSKVILIFLVVLGHFIEINKGNLGEEVYWLIYSFHMPAFIFIAGYFSKKEEWKETIKMSINRFLIPYVIFQTGYDFICYIWFDRPIRLNFSLPNFALWFLLGMTYWKLTLQIIIRWKWTIILFISVFIVHRLFIPDLRYFYIGRCIYFSVFFYLGYFVKNYGNKIKINQKYFSLMKYIGFVGFVTVIYLYKINIINIPYEWFFGYLMPNEYINHFSKFYLLGYQMYVFLFSIGMMGMFFMLIPNKEYSWTQFGKTTMSVYLLHVTIRHWFVKENYMFSTENISQLIAIGTLSMLTVYIFSQNIFIQLINLISNLFVIKKKQNN